MTNRDDHLDTSDAPDVARYATYPSLLDRTVFVTGGADGIGAAVVRNFARQGSKVAFVDRNAELARRTIGDCVDAGARHTPLFYELDLLDIDALRHACRRAIADLGGVTVLVNNAASDDRHTWDEMSVDYWNDRLNSNLRHYFFAIQALAPGMIEQRFGSIVNVGSSSYMMQEDFFPGYAIAKSGVEGITRTLARTFGPDNVRVNTVLPGWCVTERQLTRWWSAEGEAETMRDQALAKRIYPDELAQMVLFLASDDSGGCTAQSYMVDGGRF